MNYITEILAFNDLLLSQPLSTGQIALWYALMYINNKCGWVEWFSSPNRTLEFSTGLSRQGINKARNSLRQLGLIDFKSNGTKSTMYKLLPMSNSVQDSIQDSIQAEAAASSTMSNSVQDSVQRSVQDSIQGSVQDSVQNSSTLNKQNKTKQNETVKASKKEREKRGADYDEILNRRVCDEKLKEAYFEFIKMRRFIKKPMTNRALEMLIEKVNALEPESVERKIELLNNAVLHNWQSVYPLKDDSSSERTDKHGSPPLRSKFNNYEDTNKTDYEKLEAELLEQMLST